MQYPDQNESVHELYQVRKETKSVVSISENFEKKGYQQCIVEFHHFSSEMGFE